MSQFVINSEASLRKYQRDVEQAFHEHKFLRVNMKAGVDRSLDQNALSHAWYNEIAIQMADTPENIKAECKLRFGVPILRAEDPDFREVYDNSILRNLTYEQKLKAMLFIPVTSSMTKAQLSRYLEHIQQSYAQQGVMVRFPDEAMTTC